MLGNIGFTGTQNGMTKFQKYQLNNLLKELKLSNSIRFHHGDCIGADAEAHEMAKFWSIPIIIHPPINPNKRAYKIGQIIYPPEDYLTRNHNIVDWCELLIAAPSTSKEILRSGTWATIRYARKMNKLVTILQPIEN